MREHCFGIDMPRASGLSFSVYLICKRTNGSIGVLIRGDQNPAERGVRVAFM